ncbi:gamma-glutamyl cyclotransferase like [Alphaentomopoxvirus acuprea]|uniref:Gamma-glutamyl cyclotransferase like n=1 Tax=Alphaentomopoxvirus acuprea TaxID=62099 RepID=W6JPN4_9POXV|nr:gamma-glutamyl cyclotransferase like [Anomala cuprea entomopoxvirus]BAO49584.1 gamma-glutamyl cyclotransferase like [Anomala cuprea entomopoxvirus]
MYVRYFGYGANQNVNYFIDKYSIYNIKIIGKFVLKNVRFKLIYSDVIKSVISTIVPDNDSVVFGILYKIPVEMINELDMQEHVDKNVYYKKKIEDVDQSYFLYIANNTNKIKLADNIDRYKNIIIDGLIDNDFPQKYIEYVQKCFDDIYF